MEKPQEASQMRKSFKPNKEVIKESPIKSQNDSSKENFDHRDFMHKLKEE